LYDRAGCSVLSVLSAVVGAVLALADRQWRKQKQQATAEGSVS